MIFKASEERKRFQKETQYSIGYRHLVGRARVETKGEQIKAQLEKSEYR